MRREEGVVFRETILDGAAERGLIARRGDLFVVGKTGRIAVQRLLHAEQASLFGHHLREGWLITTDVFGDDNGNVVGGLGDDGTDSVFHADGFARLEI